MNQPPCPEVVVVPLCPPLQPIVDEDRRKAPREGAVERRDLERRNQTGERLDQEPC